MTHSLKAIAVLLLSLLITGYALPKIRLKSQKLIYKRAFLDAIRTKPNDYNSILLYDNLAKNGLILIWKLLLISAPFIITSGIFLLHGIPICSSFALSSLTYLTLLRENSSS